MVIVGLALDSPKHGTYNGYNNYGCRCERCQQARRDWNREHRTPEQIKRANEKTKAWYHANKVAISAAQKVKWQTEGKFKYRKYHLMKIYGISEDDYNKMLKSQGWGCASCGKHYQSHKRAFAVDHDHDTGKIRGILCLNCNTALGLLQDDKEIIYKLLKYKQKVGAS